VLLLGYSFSICNKCGYFNISQEAQMYASSLALVYVSKLVPDLPVPVRWTLMIAASFAVSSLVCVIPVFLKMKLGVNEVVSGVMLNYLMKFINQHLIAFGSIAGKRTSSITSINVPEKMSATTITITMVIIIISFVLILRDTIPGFRLTVTGKNPRFSQASGINVNRVIYLSAVIGGCLSAFCMISELLGYYGQIFNEFASGMGNDGLTVAFIGNNSPIGMIFGALLLGALKAGSIILSIRTQVPTELVDCVQGLIMFFATIKFFDFSRSSVKKNKKKDRPAVEGGR
jgi:simple sugar transport system permease protein